MLTLDISPLEPPIAAARLRLKREALFRAAEEAEVEWAGWAKGLRRMDEERRRRERAEQEETNHADR